jgi:hypothetical protein
MTVFRPVKQNLDGEGEGGENIITLTHFLLEQYLYAEVNSNKQKQSISCLFLFID